MSHVAAIAGFLRRTLPVLALVGYTLLCLLFTLPGGARFTSRAVWDSPHNQQQFTRWAATLSQLGVDVSGPQLQRTLWGATKHYSRARDRLLRPLRWLPEQVGFGQSWRMFSNPQTTPSQLWIELDSGNGFTPIYVSRSSEHAWRHSFFEHHRIRKLLGRIGRGGKDSAYEALSDWIAKRAFADFPQAKRIRVRSYTWTTPAPAAGGPTMSEFRKGKFHHQKLFVRSEVTL